MISVLHVKRERPLINSKYYITYTGNTLIFSGKFEEKFFLSKNFIERISFCIFARMIDIKYFYDRREGVRIKIKMKLPSNAIHFCHEITL